MSSVCSFSRTRGMVSNQSIGCILQSVIFSTVACEIESGSGLGPRLVFVDSADTVKSNNRQP